MDRATVIVLLFAGGFFAFAVYVALRPRLKEFFEKRRQR